MADLLYRDTDALFVALDANFRLRRRAVSSNETDPSLSQGWAYFVEDSAFKKYLCDHKNDVQEVRSHTPDLLASSDFICRKVHVRIIMLSIWLT